ncbi:MAG: hypothetical protein MRK02_10470 [Candidatus Scalindua sp.]|nr:hypothetical protein [Candidatus Scalindua sp.]
MPKITCNIQVMNEYYKRKLRLLGVGSETFFLWGARQTGKSTLLKKIYPRSLWIDLLKSEEYRRYIDILNIFARKSLNQKQDL